MISYALTVSSQNRRAKFVGAIASIREKPDVETHRFGVLFVDAHTGSASPSWKGRKRELQVDHPLGQAN
jgi:hypothetical protein